MGEPLTSYARRFFAASKLVPARELISLAIEATENTQPAQVQIDWTTDLDDFALDVSTGIDRQGYYLLRNGAVAIVNRKGREVDRIPSEAPIDFTVVPRVYAGEDGAVYTAHTRDEPLTDDESGEKGAGRIVRWIKKEEGQWEKAWTAVIPERISTFTFRLQFLWWAEDPRRIDEELGRLPAAVGRLSNPLLSGAIGTRQDIAPRPIFDIAISDNGAAFISAPENPDRGTRDGIAFTQRSVGFTPPELESWEFNGLFWVDATSLGEEGDTPIDGDAITLLRDKRKDPTDFPAVDEDEPDRTIMARDAEGLFTSPSFDQSAFGGFGGIAFSEFAMMHSGPNEDVDDTTKQLAVFPGSSDAWMVMFAIQLTEDQIAATGEVRQIMSQVNYDTAEGSWQLRVDGNELTFIDLNTSLATVGPAPIDSVSGAAVVAIEHQGAGNVLSMYVNGERFLGTTPSTNPNSGGEHSLDPLSSGIEPGPRTTIGGGIYNTINLLLDGDVDIFGFAESRVRDQDENTKTKNRRSRVTVNCDFGASFVPSIDALYLNFRVGTADDIDITLRMSSNIIGDGFPDPEVRRGYRLELTEDRKYKVDLAVNEDGSPEAYRYLQIEMDADRARENTQWTLRTIHARFYAASFESAEFFLSEIISRQHTPIGDIGNRQTFEGYLAHKVGIAHELKNESGDLLLPENGGHPFNGPGNFPGAIGDPSIDGAVLGKIRSPDPLIVKYNADGSPVAAYSGAGVGLGAAVDGRKVYTYGDPTNDLDPLTTGTIINRLRDKGRIVEREAGIPAGSDIPFERPTPLHVGPGSSLFVNYSPTTGLVAQNQVRRYDGIDMSLVWSLNAAPRMVAIDVAGRQLDAREIGGDFGPEFLYAARDNIVSAQRVDVLGLRDNGVEETRDVATLAVCRNGDVARLDGEAWTILEAGALPGPMVGTATLSGRTIIADGVGYRVYDHNLQTLRDFEESARGDFPPRCKLVAAYRGRLVLARGDEAFTVYQSAVGDAFNFDFGPEVLSIAQAIAGTTASNGQSPEPITALIPFRDDLLFIGTTESLFVITGDLADGGRLDQIDKSQGVAFGYAWCETPQGIYYFTSRGGVMYLAPNGGLRLVSDPSVQRRMEEVDLNRARVELAYNWIDKAVHIYVIPFDLGGDVEHFVYEERTGSWQIDTYGNGFGSAITTAASLVGDTPEERTVVLGTGDGRALRWDQYAVDDDGQPVASYVSIGPVVPENEGAEVNIAGIYGVLATDQEGVEVGVRGSNTPDAPGPPGQFSDLGPGRTLGVQCNVTAPSVFIDVRGKGRAWSAHQMRADVRMRGRARRV